MKLYFDIGNTNIKLNFNYKDIEYYHNYDTSIKYTVDTFYNELPKYIKESKITHVIISSVVPRQEGVIVGMVKKYWSIKPMQIKFPIKTGLKIKSTDPKKVGSDLIALSAFVASKTDNGIMVNLGTTTTIIPVVNSEMIGGVISPGLGASLRAIFNNSSLIGDVQLLEDIGNKFVGRNTQEAISIGVLRGHIGSIKYIVNNIDEKAKVFISGGHARKLMKYLPEYEFVKEATIEGMKIIEKMNED